MPTTDAQKKARDKWLKEKVEDIRFRVPMGKKAAIKEHADRQGESVNAFILRAVEQTMEQDMQEEKKNIL